jgi:hypothetical protein
MEIFRKKNIDTRIVFPIVDADGDAVSSAADLDSEYISWDSADHGGAAPSASDCGHEATEIGSTGIYYLDVGAAEINKDFTLIQIKTSTSGAKTQMILICTIPRDANATQLLGTAWATPATAGLPDVNAKQLGGTAQTGGDVGAKTGFALTAAYDAAKTAASQTSVNTIDDLLDTEVAAILADTNELQTDLVNGGRLDLLIDAIKAKTDNLPASPANETTVAAVKAKTDALPAIWCSP